MSSKYYNKDKAKLYYEKNKEKLYKVQRKRYYKYKNIIYSHYGYKCNCCEETGKSFLTIDHVNNDGYKERWKGKTKIVGEKFYRKIIKENFPDKYQILCMNCNWSKLINDGVCEHKLIK